MSSSPRPPSPLLPPPPETSHHVLSYPESFSTAQAALQNLQHLHQDVPQTTQTQPGQNGAHRLHSPHNQLLLLDAPSTKRALPHSSQCGGHSGICFLPGPLPICYLKSCQSVCHTSHGSIHLLPTQPLTCQGHHHHLPPGRLQPLPNLPISPLLLLSFSNPLTVATKVEFLKLKT